MKSETKFILLRISIYLTGLFIIIWVISTNVWEIKEKKEVLIKSEQGDYSTFNQRNYEKASLLIEFENQIPEQLTVELEKDFSIFTTRRKKGIYEENDLKQKFFKNNPTPHPNGSFLLYQKNIYFLDEGILRKISTSRILEIFNLNKKDLPEINQDEFEKLPQGEILEFTSIQNDFPQNILIEKGNSFYLTGSNGHYPLHIPNISQIIEDLQIQKTKISAESSSGKCYKQSDQKIICDFKLKNQKSTPGDIYLVKIKSNNQPVQNLKTAIINLQANPTFSEILEETKKLFTK